MSLNPLLAIQVGMLITAIILSAALPPDLLLSPKLSKVVAGVVCGYFMALLTYWWVLRFFDGPDFYPEILYAIALYVAGMGIALALRQLRISRIRARSH